MIATARIMQHASFSSHYTSFSSFDTSFSFTCWGLNSPDAAPLSLQSEVLSLATKRGVSWSQTSPFCSLGEERDKVGKERARGGFSSMLLSSLVQKIASSEGMGRLLSSAGGERSRPITSLWSFGMGS